MSASIKRCFDNSGDPEDADRKRPRQGPKPIPDLKTVITKVAGLMPKPMLEKILIESAMKEDSVIKKIKSNYKAFALLHPSRPLLYVNYIEAGMIARDTEGDGMPPAGQQFEIVDAIVEGQVRQIKRDPDAGVFALLPHPAINTAVVENASQGASEDSEAKKQLKAELQASVANPLSDVNQNVMSRTPASNSLKGESAKLSTGRALAPSPLVDSHRPYATDKPGRLPNGDLKFDHCVEAVTKMMNEKFTNRTGFKATYGVHYYKHSAIEDIIKHGIQKMIEKEAATTSFETKMNALIALKDISFAILHAKPSKFASTTRNSEVTQAKIRDLMVDIVKLMTASEKGKLLANEKWLSEMQTLKEEGDRYGVKFVDPDAILSLCRSQNMAEKEIKNEE
ncbi:hypothetical protein G7Y89_g10783 [Cudoniella acicularis]|uniref:Uncharacterized protein n=1 Tax=Cudoniella acicularis TaxID=354080 RepID=A0A8H4VYF7_9HELO|nr:hypothetical protein G7Y89_g10783 [Cudoniella acicularis]